MHYTQAMIKTFAHKGLERFFLTGSKRGITAQHAARIGRLLDRLEASVEVADMNLPGYRFHELTGKRKGTYSVTVSGNWRITFAFRQGSADNVTLEDYH
ncbi:HigB toxin protein [hydrothermal vent metagenome]|uniref:HigB toxin protein n=1 Tax=hydrothermal vent metagenome TaxID=652676 RepID=A0A3B1AGG0_9ZZZZ